MLRFIQRVMFAVVVYAIVADFSCRWRSPFYVPYAEVDLPPEVRSKLIIGDKLDDSPFTAPD